MSEKIEKQQRKIKKIQKVDRPAPPSHPMSTPQPTSDVLADDFRVFMTILWNEMGLPQPTPMQLLFADTLQKSKDPRLCLLGFRGFAKTYICAAFLIWLLYRNPKLQIAIWGSNQDNAGATTKFMLRWLKDIPWLNHLAPTGELDQSALSFDVQGRGSFRGSSVMAFGIGGSVTGTRADILLVDDPETSSNGDTAKRRAQIDRAMGEAGYVIKPGGRIIVLGTIHFNDSVYLRLMAQKYRVWLFPMAVPSLETQKQCWSYYLAPIRKKMESLPVDAPLDRFTETDIELRRANGVLSFERQCLVNPFSSSLTQKPFNMRKIIIFQADTEKLPVRFFHNQDDRFLDEEAMDYSSASLIDKLYNPYRYDEQLAPYEYKLVYIDPAGKGGDEVAVIVIGVCMGYVVLFHSEGLIGGSKEENLERIIEVARRFKANEICVEDNFGQGMFAQLLYGIYQAEFARFGSQDNIIPITTNHKSKNKEQRILQILDPVINSGKLIVTKDCLIVDYESANAHTQDDRMIYRLTYQISYFSESGNKLEHDDRIDSLGSACEKVKGFLVDHPSNKAKTWDDRLIETIFKKDTEQFTGEPYSEPQERILVNGHRRSFL